MLPTVRKTALDDAPHIVIGCDGGGRAERRESRVPGGRQLRPTGQAVHVRSHVVGDGERVLMVPAEVRLGGCDLLDPERCTVCG